MVINNNSTPADWAALSTLMRRPWFSRRWIIQEIALGKSPELICGEKSVPWQDFADVISMAAYKQSELQQLFRSSTTYQNHPDYLGDLSELGAIRLAQVSNELFLKGEDGSIQERLFTLEGLMSSLTAFEASEPRDILYAILWLASDAEPNYKAAQSSATFLVQSPTIPTASPFVVHSGDVNEQSRRSRAASELGTALRRRHVDVDYDKSVLEVCKDFLRFAMNRSGSLDMLCFPWAPNDDSLPSWIPQLKGSAFWPNRNQVHRRINADPLVGRPGHPGPSIAPYRACKGQPAKFKFEEGDAYSLKVRGFALYKVLEKKAAALNGTIPAEWLEAAGWRDTTQRPPDVFWRTMIGNRGPDGHFPPVYWWQMCREVFNFRPAGDSLATNEVVFDNPGVKQFVKRVQRMAWRRRLVTLSSESLIKSTSSIALAPEGTKKGDLICILYGCSVPVVLREMIGGRPAAKQQKCGHPECPSHRDLSSNPPSTHHQFVGECYVHGVMDGQALDVRPKEGIMEQDFVLK